MNEPLHTDPPLRRLGRRALLLTLAAAFVLLGALMLMPLPSVVSVVGTFWIWAPQRELHAFQDDPLAYYVLRTAGVAHLWLGAVLVLPLVDPVRYRPVIDISMAALMIMGLTCFVSGLSGQVAVLLFALDGLACFAAVVGLWLLRPRPCAPEPASSAS